jgi:hypothetical protein
MAEFCETGVLDSVVERLDEAESEAREEFADLPVDEETMDKAVRNRKWELVGDELPADHNGQE